MKSIGICPTNILLPRGDVHPTTWACVACDQYTSQPEYWQDVALQVGDAPSTLKLMLPECYLSETAQRVPVINQTMQDYLDSGILQQAVTDGYVLVERSTLSGQRVGLVCAVDLEQYDYTPGAKPLVRPTEETIAARLPARLAIRQGAAIEMSHILMLVDDPMQSVIEPLYMKRGELRPLYDFPLMKDGGHLRGWAVEADDDKAAIAAALEQLKARQGETPLLFAVGDGNHSLATAKAAWEALKPQLNAQQQETHPARYALCEVENIHDDALTFEPIHRIITGVDGAELMADWTLYCHQRGMDLSEGEAEQQVQVIYGGMELTAAIQNPDGAIPVDTLQRYLDDYLRRHPEAEIDYIHGDDVLRALAQQPNAIGFLVPPIDKSTFFSAIQQLGTLPRKTFSMGHAHEKRFYMECKKIR
ncbi:MAG: DUF1015 domain-containing protein [Clostridia bacterium]|nr:DUF1015 domain-containing protein [Clostridia bacterium]